MVETSKSSDRENFSSVRIFGTTLRDFDTRYNEYDREFIAMALELESSYYTNYLKNGNSNGRKMQAGRRVEELRVKQWTQRLSEESSVRCLQSETVLRNRNTYI